MYLQYRCTDPGTVFTLNFWMKFHHFSLILMIMSENYPWLTLSEVTTRVVGNVQSVLWHRCFEDLLYLLLASPPADWRRQLGRPRITWLSTIQQDLKQHHLTLPEAADLAQNHPLWRMMSTWRYAIVSCMPETTKLAPPIQFECGCCMTCKWHDMIIHKQQNVAWLSNQKLPKLRRSYAVAFLQWQMHYMFGDGPSIIFRQ